MTKSRLMPSQFGTIFPWTNQPCNRKLIPKWLPYERRAVVLPEAELPGCRLASPCTVLFASSPIHMLWISFSCPVTTNIISSTFYHEWRVPEIIPQNPVKRIQSKSADLIKWQKWPTEDATVMPPWKRENRENLRSCPVAYSISLKMEDGILYCFPQSYQ